MQSTRREFLKYTTGGIAALVAGKAIPSIMEDEAYAAVQTQVVHLTITDALKDMATHNDINTAQCYYWIFKADKLAADCPGPHIFVTEGQPVKMKVKNALTQPHSFYIRGVVSSKPIAPGATKEFTFKAPKAGTYMYYDRLNGPVNRVMGLHGAFISMPSKPKAPNKFTPYGNATPPNIQRLFNDFGSAAWWPGLAWHQGDPATHTERFRQYIWILHQASPNLFAEVGAYTPGQDYPAAQFVTKFLHDAFTGNSNQNLVGTTGVPTNNVPQYFTISGQSGHFSHNTPYICPNNRVGEPVLIRLLNAGLWSHSMHIHANHVYVTSVNGKHEAFPGQVDNPIWIDVYTLNPMDVVDWVVPYMRPPDVPNARGIGRADTPKTSNNGQPVWPPNEELNTFLPGPGVVVTAAGQDLKAQLSPLCYPMHDHSEPSQTAQGGNYNMGMISGINFTGDRNTPGAMNYPNQPLLHGCDYHNGVHPVAVGPPWFSEG